MFVPRNNECSHKNRDLIENPLSPNRELFTVSFSPLTFFLRLLTCFRSVNFQWILLSELESNNLGFFLLARPASDHWLPRAACPGSMVECGVARTSATNLLLPDYLLLFTLWFLLFTHLFATASWVRYETNEHNERDEKNEVKKICSKYGTMRTPQQCTANKNEKWSAASFFRHTWGQFCCLYSGWLPSQHLLRSQLIHIWLQLQLANIRVHY